MNCITVIELVQSLGEKFLQLSEDFSPEFLLHYGHIKGWLEDQDELYPFTNVDKRTAARIIHQFIRIELKIQDEIDISKAEVLKDLYTCRVCVNHISQVFVKGIMQSEEIEDPTTGEIIQIFNMTKEISWEEIHLQNIFNNFSRA